MATLACRGQNMTIADGATTWMILTNKNGDEVARTALDTTDMPTIGLHRWSATRHRATTYVSRGESSTRRTLYLHRILLMATAGEDVDHMDGDGLNNRRANLRRLSGDVQMQNIAHVGRELLRGITFNPRAGSKDRPWCVRVQIGKVRHWVGHFSSEQEARDAASSFRTAHAPWSNENRHR